MRVSTSDPECAYLSFLMCTSPAFERSEPQGLPSAKLFRHHSPALYLHAGDMAVVAKHPVSSVEYYEFKEPLDSETMRALLPFQTSR